MEEKNVKSFLTFKTIRIDLAAFISILFNGNKYVVFEPYCYTSFLFSGVQNYFAIKSKFTEMQVYLEKRRNIIPI